MTLVIKACYQKPTLDGCYQLIDLNFYPVPKLIICLSIYIIEFIFLQCVFEQ